MYTMQLPEFCHNNDTAFSPSKRHPGIAALRCARSLFAALCLLCGTLAGADVVLLQDRDAFSGQVLRIEDGILVFRTAHTGQLMAPMDSVRSLKTNNNLMITLEDERVLYGRFEAGDKQLLIPLDGGDPLPLDLSAVLEGIVIPSESRAEEEAPDVQEWRSVLGTGLQFRDGASDSLEPFLHLEVLREREADRLHGALRLERSDSEDFPAWLRGSLQWEGTDEAARVHPYAAWGIERDRNNILELRTDLSLGVAYPFDWSEQETLHALLGLNLDYEAWDAAALRDRQGNRVFLEDLRRRGLHLNVQLGLRYSRALWGERASIKESLTLYPSISDWGDMRMRSETILRMEVTPRLQLRFDLMVDFDNRPDYDGYADWITTIGAGFEYRF